MSASAVPRERDSLTVAGGAAAPSDAVSSAGMPRDDDGQEATDQPRERRDEQDPARQVTDVDPEPEQVVHRPTEDRIGRREQHREDHHERDR